jgi:hypothetical protein
VCGAKMGGGGVEGRGQNRALEGRERTEQTEDRGLRQCQGPSRDKGLGSDEVLCSTVSSLAFCHRSLASLLALTDRDFGQ